MYDDVQTPAQKRAATKEARVQAALQAARQCAQSQPAHGPTSRGYGLLLTIAGAALRPGARSMTVVRAQATACIAAGCERLA